MPLTRRALIGATASVPLFAAILARAGQAPPPRSPLRLAPPRLDDPGRIVLTDDYLDRHPSIDLRGAGRDWLIELPTDRYLTRPVTIHGHDQARHIVIVGGGIKPVARYDPATMRGAGGDYAIYALRGFSGATGGRFRFRIQEKSYIRDAPPPYTAWLPWNATPAQIAAALEQTAGPGSVFAVDGNGDPGGPWKIVPANRPLLGRPVLDVSGLTGRVTKVQRNVFKAAAGCGLLAKQWRGTLHCEGIHVGGPYMCDGIDIQNPWDGAIAQFANVHSDPSFHLFHDDWVHPDGAQFYLGPSIARMENVDLVSLGGNGFISQPRKAPQPRQLQALHDWWLRNCHFRTIADDRNGRLAEASTACYREEDYPRSGDDKSGQHWDAQNVYCSRVRASTGQLIRNDRKSKYYHYTGTDTDADIRLDQVPPAVFFADPDRRECGPGYRTPGYQPQDFTVSPNRTPKIA